MKKIISLLLIIPFFLSCSSDEETTNPKSTEPLKGDNITVGDVVGAWKPNRSYLVLNNEETHFLYKQSFVFREDMTGYDYTFAFDKSPFTWELKDNIIYFKHSKYGDVKAWMKNNRICFKGEYDENTKAICEYIKTEMPPFD